MEFISCFALIGLNCLIIRKLSWPQEKYTQFIIRALMIHSSSSSSVVYGQILCQIFGFVFSHYQPNKTIKLFELMTVSSTKTSFGFRRVYYSQKKMSQGTLFLENLLLAGTSGPHLSRQIPHLCCYECWKLNESGKGTVEGSYHRIRSEKGPLRTKKDHKLSSLKRALR